MDLMGLVPDLESHDVRQPVIKHDCKVAEEEDEVKKWIKGDDLLARLKCWFTRWRIVSTSHYYAQTCLKSSHAIRYEVRRHLQYSPYMIHPFSPFRNVWDLIMTAATLIIIMLTPFLNAFLFNEQVTALPFILAIDFVLMIDVILHFCTGYFDARTKTVTMNWRVVFVNYVKGYFFLDFLSSLPVEIFDYFVEGDKHIEWYCSTFNFLKVIRMRNLINYIEQMQKSYHISFQNVKIIELTLIIIIALHWSACLVYYVPMLTEKNTDRENATSWILSESMQKRNTKVKKYILCLNRATISLVNSAHYLNVNTSEDMIMNFVLSIFGKIGLIYLLARFLQLMSTLHSSNKERLRLLQQLQEYMQYKELPKITQRRLMVYCDYWYKKNFTRDKRILAQVSEPLREELIFHNYKKLLETVDLFQLLPEQAIIQLVNFIKPQIYLTSDTIVKSGTHGDSLFFVGSGTVAVYTSLGKEVCHLEDGSYFGEIALVMENELRVASVVAIETCEIMVVPREAFQQVIAPYPNLLSRLQKVALERLEKTLLLDEIYRLEDPHPQYINISNIRGKRRD